MELGIHCHARPLSSLVLASRIARSGYCKSRRACGTDFPFPFVRKHPLLVLRALDDEASLALAAAAIGNRLSRLLARWSYKIWVVLVMLSGVVVLVFSVFAITIGFFQVDIDQIRHLLDRYQPDLSFWFELSFKWVFWSWLGLLFAFFAFLFSPKAFKSFYGRELLLHSQGCEINSQSAPDSIDRQSEFQSASESIRTNWETVVTLHQGEEVQGRLRHGLYDDPQCAERIAGWLKSELARGGR